MPYKAKVLKVMIASPGDVAAARTVTRDVILEWNAVHSEKEDIVLLPIGWESHASPSMGDRPQAIINKQVLADTDLLIAVFWTRLGSPTGKAPSGTVEEIEKHLKTGKPAMIYFSSVPVVPESIDQKQYSALLKFKQELLSRGLVETYSSILEFKEKLTRQLAQTVNRCFARKKKGRSSEGPESVVQPNHQRMPALADRAKKLLLEASQDSEGIVIRLRTMHGLTVQTNGQDFVDNGDPHTGALWEGVVRQLLKNELLQDRGHKGEIFAITDEGYRIADLLRAEQLVGARSW